MRRGILKQDFQTKFARFYELEIPAGTECAIIGDNGNAWVITGFEWVKPDETGLIWDIKHRYIFVPNELVKVVKTPRYEREIDFAKKYSITTAPVLLSLRAAKLYTRYTGKFAAF